MSKRIIISAFNIILIYKNMTDQICSLHIRSVMFYL